MSVATVPDYLVGTWNIDPIHSEIGFSVRHMLVSKVRGKFTSFSGQIITAEDPLASSATVSVDLNSIDTSNEQRDDHVRSADFFDVANHPTMTYRSTGVRRDGDDYILDGELTLRGVTKAVPLKVELSGFGPDPYGGTRVGFSGTGELNRSDFGVSFNGVLETGGVVVGEKVTLQLDIQGVLA